MEDRKLSEAEQQQRREAARKHGVRAYEDTGLLAEEHEGFDTALAAELLEQVGGDPAYRLLVQSVARRATILEMAYAWLGREDVPVFWVEDDDGHKILKWQPILNRLGSYHEGLRRDLDSLGLSPLARSRLGLEPGKRAIDYEELLRAQQKKREEG